MNTIVFWAVIIILLMVLKHKVSTLKYKRPYKPLKPRKTLKPPIQEKSSQSLNDTSTPENTEPQQEPSQYYLKKYFLTSAEADFYQLLHRYLHNTQYHIFSQVSYSAIHNKYLNKGYSLNAYFLDFLICTHDFHPICAIELDDLSHQHNNQVIERDHLKNEFFNSIKNNCKHDEKFEFFRIPFNTKKDFYSSINIEFTKKFSELLSYLLEKETCTVCNSPMIICRNKETATFFWGCPLYKEEGHSGKGKDILK